tara:strand:- start:1575 stop:3251 length:1677 start_codon:yes stop_codon:yes gene_type:complete
MAKRRKRVSNKGTLFSNNTVKYSLIGVVILGALLLIFNFAPTGQFIDVQVECTWTPTNIWYPESEPYCSNSDGDEILDDSGSAIYTTQDACEVPTWGYDDLQNISDVVQGTCSNTDKTNQRNCVNYHGICTDSDGNDLDENSVWRWTTCNGRAGICMDSEGAETSNSGKSNCENVQGGTWIFTGTWTPDNTWTPYTWTTVAEHCEDGTSTTEEECLETAGTCLDTGQTTKTDCLASTSCTTQQLDDVDNDGVDASIDFCPNTPESEINNVNGVGCHDTDGDGIYDNLDLVWELSKTGITTDTEEIVVDTYSLENDGTFRMNIQAREDLKSSCSNPELSTKDDCELPTYEWIPTAPAFCSDYAGNDITTGAGINDDPYNTPELCSNGDTEGTWRWGECSIGCICIDSYDNAIARYTDPVTGDKTQYWEAESQCHVTWNLEVPGYCEDETYSDQATCEATQINAWTEADEILIELEDVTVLVKVTYYDLETNEELSSTIYTSQLSVGEVSSEAFSISIPQIDSDVSYIATVNIWSGLIGTDNWKPYSEKIELRGEFHPTE